MQARLALAIAIVTGLLPVTPIYKSLPAVDRAIPIDLTLLVMALLLALLWTHITTSIGNSKFRDDMRSAIPPILGLWLLFSVPLFWSNYALGAEAKPVLVFAILLPAMMAPVVGLSGLSAHMRHRWLVIFLGVVVALMAVGILGLFATDIAPSRRMGAFGEGPLTTSARMAGLAIVVVAAYVRLGRLRPAIGGPLLLILSGGLIATGGRAPFATTALTIGVLLLASTSRSIREYGKARVVLFGLVVAAAFVIGWSLAPGGGGSRLGEFLGGEYGFDQTRRWEVYASAVSISLSNPWGIGWGNFSALTGWGYPHNFVLEVFTEAGLISGLVLVLLFVSTVTRLWRNRTQTLALVSLVIIVHTWSAGMWSSDVVGNRTAFIALAIGIVVATFDDNSGKRVAKVPRRSSSGSLSLEEFQVQPN